MAAFDSGPEAAIAAAVFRHQLRDFAGQIAYLAIGPADEDPDAALLARFADESVPVRPLSEASTSTATVSSSSTTTVSGLPEGPWWKKALAVVGLAPAAPPVTAGVASRRVTRRVTDGEGGRTGAVFFVRAIRLTDDDTAEVDGGCYGEPLSASAVAYRAAREGDAWAVAETGRRPLD